MCADVSTSPFFRLRASEVHWRLLQTQLLWACESLKAACDSTPRAPNLAPTTAWYLVAGRFRLVQDGQTIDLPPGEWLFPSGNPRGQYFEPGTILLSIGFSARWPHGVDLIHNPRACLLPLAECHELTAKARALVAATSRISGLSTSWFLARNWHEDTTLESHFEVEGAFQSWLVCFIRIVEANGAVIERMAAKDHRVQAAISELEALPRAVAPRLDDTSRSSGLSRSRLDELFRAETGLSLASFAERVHLHRVQREVLDLRRQIKEIALEAGFSHNSSFTRWFRHLTGMTPTEFRAHQTDAES